MKYKKHALALLLCGSFIMSAPHFAHAQDKEESKQEAPQEKPQEAPDVDFGKLESFGTLETIEAGSLGQGLYAGADRYTLSSLISNIQPHSDLIALQKLTNRLLLTAANAGEINNDVVISNGADLTTLRLEAMLRRGMYIQAFGLVSKLDENLFYHPRISKAGVLAMLFSGEKGSACLENNANKDRFEKDEFWSVLGAYCAITLSDTPPESATQTIEQSGYPIIKDVLSSKDYSFNYTPESFEKLSLIEKAILTAENKISLKTIDKDGIRNIPAPHLQALIKNSGNTPQQRILLISQAVNTGVLPPVALAEEFMLVNQHLAEEKRPPSGMEELAPLIKKVKGTWHIEDPQAAIAKSIAYAQEFNPAFIIPFIETYAGQSSLDGFTLEQISLIVRAFIISDTTLPKTWFANILARATPSDEEAFLKTKLVMATAVLSPEKALNQFKTANYRTNFSQDRAFQLLSYKNIIENIDNPTDQYARVRYIYENGFDSSWNKSYTMPPYAVLSELRSAAQKNVVTDVIALSNLLAAGIDGKTIYSGLVAEMLGNLTAVGLSKQAKEIVAQAILDIK